MQGIEEITKNTGMDSARPSKTMGDPKDYLEMMESSNGDLRVKLYLPPFELDELKLGLKKPLTLQFTSE